MLLYLVEAAEWAELGVIRYKPPAVVAFLSLASRRVFIGHVLSPFRQQAASSGLGESPGGACFVIPDQ